MLSWNYRPNCSCNLDILSLGNLTEKCCCSFEEKCCVIHFFLWNISCPQKGCCLFLLSSFQMSQPEEAGGCFHEVANTTNILLASVLDLGTFVGKLERSNSFQYLPTPPNIHSPWPQVMPPSVWFHILPSDCWPTAVWCCAGSLFCLFPVLLKPFSSLLQLRLLSISLYLVWFCGIKTAGDEAVTSERHSSSKELRQISAFFFLCQGL